MAVPIEDAVGATLKITVDGQPVIIGPLTVADKAEGTCALRWKRTLEYVQGLKEAGVHGEPLKAERRAFAREYSAVDAERDMQTNEGIEQVVGAMIRRLNPERSEEAIHKLVWDESVQEAFNQCNSALIQRGVDLMKQMEAEGEGADFPNSPSTGANSSDA